MAIKKEPKQKIIWDNRVALGEVQKLDNVKTVVQLVARTGVKYINIHDWYCKKGETEYKPSWSGISLPILVPIDGVPTKALEQLMEIIKTGIAMAPTFAIEDVANRVYAKPKET